MRIGIDFDNTIICYDKVFCNLAKSWQLVEPDYQGSKLALRDKLRGLPDGDLIWQRLQGKVYGEFISEAEIFTGFKEFVITAKNFPDVELFIVSHKTELGHFDTKQINLRDAARHWLRSQGFFSLPEIQIPETNLYFETTREDKINRIKTLGCTHFIDDLIEVLDEPSFPKSVKKFLFEPSSEHKNWIEIKNAIFS